MHTEIDSSFCLAVQGVCGGLCCLGCWSSCVNFECASIGNYFVLLSLAKEKVFCFFTWGTQDTECLDLLQGGHIIFFQSLSLLGYCLFPLDIGALICMFKSHSIINGIIVLITLAWSSWAAYPFVSAAVSSNRKALAVYPVFLLYVSIGFFIFAV